MRLRIERHRLGPWLGKDSFDYSEFVWRIFVENVQRAFTRRAEHQARLGFIDVGVHTAADWKSLDDLSVVRIHNRKQFVSASNKESPVLSVHGHRSRCYGSRERPPR